MRNFAWVSGSSGRSNDDLLQGIPDRDQRAENLDRIDVQLVRFEQEPSNARNLDNIFRLVHTIKGTCGFIGLPRLEALAHAAEAVMGKFRDGMPATADAVTLILATIDRLKLILDRLEATQAEPEESDRDLIEALDQIVDRGRAEPAREERLAPVLNQRRPMALNSRGIPVRTAGRSRDACRAPVDPRRRRYAGNAHDDGVGAGADAQPVYPISSAAATIPISRSRCSGCRQSLPN